MSRTRTNSDSPFRTSAVVCTALALLSCGGTAGQTPPTLRLGLDRPVVDVCGSVTLSVVDAAGAEGPYAWFEDGVRMPGENSSALTIHPVLAGHDGRRFRAEVASGQGRVSSNEVTLRVQTKPEGLIELAHVRASYLILTPTTIFWTNDVGVYRAPIECAYPITALYERSGLFEDNQSIAVSSDQVYWSNGHVTSSLLMSIPIAGGLPTPLMSFPRLLGDLVVAGDALFVADFYAATIFRIPLSGGAIEAIPVGSYPANAPNHLVSDGVSLFWWDAGAKTINSIPTLGGAVSTLAQDQEMVWALTVDGGEVFWTNEVHPAPDEAVGTVSKMSTGGGEPVVIARHGGAAYGIAVDRTHVYWTTHPGLDHLADVGAATLRRVPRGGGTAVEMATGLTLPWAIGVGADHVYVGERPWASPGRLVKVAK